MERMLLLGLAAVIIYLVLAAILFFALKKHRWIVVAVSLLIPAAVLALLSQLRCLSTDYNFPVERGRQKEDVARAVEQGFCREAFATAANEIGLAGKLTYEEFEGMLTFDAHQDENDKYVVMFDTGNGWKSKHEAAKRIADSLAGRARVEEERMRSEPTHSTAAPTPSEGEGRETE